MGNINALLDALDERTIAREIGLTHDEARMQYRLDSNTVRDFDEFSRTIADYYNHHFTACVSGGGSLSVAEAGGRAKEIIGREYRRRGGDVTSAFNNAHDGTDGGVRAVLDIICEGIKAECVERYIRDMFDRHVAPNSWDDKVDIIRQFISRCGAQLSASIRASQPEAYLYCATLLKKCNSFMRLTFQGNGPHGKGTSWSDDLRYENATFFKRPRFSRKSMRVC